MPEAGASIGAFVPCGRRSEPRFHWLCVRTGFTAEILADQFIRGLGLCTWLPLHLSNKRIRPLFPRYLFVQADLAEDKWRGIYRSPGVDGVLGARFERPAFVPARFLEKLWLQCGPNGVIYEAPPPVVGPIPLGTRLRLAAGSMARDDLTGICQWSNAKRVGLLLTIMGRAVPVTVDRAAVEAV